MCSTHRLAHACACLPPCLQDEDRAKAALNEVLSWHDLNQQLARGPDVSVGTAVCA